MAYADRDAEPLGAASGSAVRTVVSMRLAAPLQAKRVLPCLEAERHVAVQEESLARKPLEIGFGSQLFGQDLAADRVDLIAIEPDRMEMRARIGRQQNGRVERVADPVDQVRTRVDVDVQPRVAFSNSGSGNRRCVRTAAVLQSRRSNCRFSTAFRPGEVSRWARMITGAPRGQPHRLPGARNRCDSEISARLSA